MLGERGRQTGIGIPRIDCIAHASMGAYAPTLHANRHNNVQQGRVVCKARYAGRKLVAAGRIPVLGRRLWRGLAI